MPLPTNQDALALAKLLRSAAYTIERLCVQIDEMRVDIPRLNESPNIDLNEFRAVLRLSVRSRKILERLGIFTIKQLTALTESELRKLKGCGVISANEIIAELNKNGLTLAKEGKE